MPRLIIYNILNILKQRYKYYNANFYFVFMSHKFEEKETHKTHKTTDSKGNIYSAFKKRLMKASTGCYANTEFRQILMPSYHCIQPVMTTCFRLDWDEKPEWKDHLKATKQIWIRFLEPLALGWRVFVLCWKREDKQIQ